MNDIHSLAINDEAQYLKAVQEKEVKAQMKEDEDARRQMQSKHYNMHGLSQ